MAVLCSVLVELLNNKIGVYSELIIQRLILKKRDDSDGGGGDGSLEEELSCVVSSHI